MDKESAKARVSELVAKFNQYDRDGKIERMNEENTKSIFIDPLFEALGWNLRDLDEVSKENQVLRGRADYAFKVSGVVRFYAEAKAASASLEEKDKWQAINYSYMKSVPWAVLTNFRELWVFNSDWQTKMSEDSRFMNFSAYDYCSNFDNLWLLGKEMVSHGEIERKAEEYGKKQRREPVSKALYQDLMRWRSLLSKEVSKRDVRNKLSKEQIDEGVQRFLNRLIFMRTCEDRKIENERLREMLRVWQSDGRRKLVSYLHDLTGEFNDIYDSDIFAPHMAGEFGIDNEILSKIISELYQTPEGAHYDFDAIDADVLGNVYEQYLATMMRSGGSLVEKEGKRKEMGIYYTPTYIVDYIVKNTLGELISKAKSAEDLMKITVLDPACGSGSFLIRAYELLNEAYAAKNGGDYQTISGEVSQNAYFVLNKNLHGVDLDAKAIEIAELNLLLRAARTRGLLPLLSGNIKRGNSLISGTKEELQEYFGSRWEEKHPFNWKIEFKEVMDNGGFDVVVGNPPWGANIDDILDYLKKNYPKSTTHHKDIYKCFIEKGVSLLKEGGYLGFIVPSSCLFQPRYADIRLFLKNYSIIKIINLGDGVFGDEVTAPCCVIIIQKQTATLGHVVNTLELSDSNANNIKSERLSKAQYVKIKQSVYDKTIDNNFVTSFREINTNEKMFGDLVDCRDAGINYQRINVGMQSKGNSDLSERLLYDGHKQNSRNDREYLKGEDIARYVISYSTGRFVRTNYKDFIKANEVVRLDEKTYETVPKILWRQTADRPIATLDFHGAWFGRSIQAGIPITKDQDIRYLVALLNSKYLSYLYVQSVRELGRVFPQVKLNKIKQLPIHLASSSDQQPIISLVDRMLELNKRLVEMGDMQTTERQRVEEEIRQTDARIDELVYELYGITGEERKIIEDSFKK